MFPTRLSKLNFNSFAVRAASEQPGRLLEQQKTALDKLCKWFAPGSEKRGDTAIVSMPAGTGKCGVIACLPYYLASLGLEAPAKDLSNSPNGQPLYSFERPVLIMAPDALTTTRLVCQLSTLEGQEETFLIRQNIVPAEHSDEILPRVKIFESLDGLRDREAIEGYEMVIVNTGTKEFIDEENLWEDRFADDLFSLVIATEAHHYTEWTWARIMRKFEHHSQVVVFTASVYSIMNDVPALDFGEEMSQVTYYLPNDAAVEQGMVREMTPDIFNRHADPPADLRNRLFYDRKGTDNLKVYSHLLEVVKSLLDEKTEEFPEVPHMAVAIAANTTAANLVVQIWKGKYPESANAVETYNSQQTKQERRRVLSRMKADELSLIVLAGSHPLEFDHPPISIAAVMYDIESCAQYTWFVRLALRIYRCEGYVESKELTTNVLMNYDIGTTSNSYARKLENNCLVPISNWKHDMF